jgi:hypothetical protein
MSNLRDAAQQALKSLRGYRRELGCQQPCDAERALEAALEQPEQEPVATVAMDVSGAHLSWDGKYLGQRPDMKIAMLLKDLPVGTLLFSTPPRRSWRGLKEWEINADRDGLDQLDVCSWSFRKGVYFAEKALKERNL